MTPTEWPTTLVNELLDQVTLGAGHHDDGAQACAMDLIGMAIDGEWTDTPSCVHPVLSQCVHRINDHHMTTVDQRRQLVTKAGPLLLDTVDRPIAWVLVVRHRAGLTAAGLVEALVTTPPDTNLSYADLSYADLRSANLRYANLSSANLSHAYLRSADLSYADLSYADLRSAYLRSAYLSHADLRSANLSSANLSSANLRSANLRYADLSDADLSDADLSDANLSSANLRGAVYTQQTIWPSGFNYITATTTDY